MIENESHYEPDEPESDGNPLRWRLIENPPDTDIGGNDPPALPRAPLQKRRECAAREFLSMLPNPYHDPDELPDANPDKTLADLDDGDPVVVAQGVTAARYEYVKHGTFDHAGRTYEGAVMVRSMRTERVRVYPTSNVAPAYTTDEIDRRYRLRRGDK